MPFRPSPHKEEAKQAFREGASLEEVLKRFPISPKTAERYQVAVEAEGQQPPPLPPPPAVPGAPKGGAKPAMVAGGEIGTVLQPKVGTVVFTFGQEVIELDYFYLYDAYQYWKDMKSAHQVEENFSQTIKTTVKFAWETLNHIKVDKQPVAVGVKEVPK